MNTNNHKHDDHSHESNTNTHSHVHDQESLRKLINRLSRIEGHVRGIKNMIEEGRDCPDILIQIAAVRGGLDKVGRIILDEHLTQCIAKAGKSGNIDREIEQLKSALDRFF